MATASFLDLTWPPLLLLCHFPKNHYLLSLRLPAFVSSISLTSCVSCTQHTNTVFHLVAFTLVHFLPGVFSTLAAKSSSSCGHLLHAPPGHHFLCACQHLKDFPFEEIPIPQYRDQGIYMVSRAPWERSGCGAEGEQRDFLCNLSLNELINGIPSHQS